MSDWKAKRRAAGWQDKLLWLTPDAVAALAELKPLFPGESEGDILSRALVYMAEHAEAHRTTAAPSVEERLNALEGTVRELRAGQMPRRHALQPGAAAHVVPGQAGIFEFPVRRKKIYADAEAIIEHLAGIVAQGGQLNIARCWRELDEAGVAVHASASGLYAWFDRPANRGQVEKRARELKEERKAAKPAKQDWLPFDPIPEGED